MVDRRVMERDAVVLTGLRIKAARVLTKLTQEGFAEKFKFGYASVKNWELGRSIPREDTVGRILDAFVECGVKTTRDWLLFGLGSGPNHFDNTDEGIPLGTLRSDSSDFGHEMAQFERLCTKNNIRPLVVTVSDDFMRPFFFKGDIIGAESIDLKTLMLKKESLIEHPFLVEISPRIFQPRFLSSSENGLLKFWRTHQGGLAGEIKHAWLGRIVWLRRA